MSPAYTKGAGTCREGGREGRVMLLYVSCRGERAWQGVLCKWQGVGKHGTVFVLGKVAGCWV